MINTNKIGIECSHLNANLLPLGLRTDTVDMRPIETNGGTISPFYNKNGFGERRWGNGFSFSIVLRGLAGYFTAC